MSAGPHEPSADRPVLYGQVQQPVAINPPQARSTERVRIGDESSRVARLDQQFNAAMAAFESEIKLTTTLQAANPELVLVLEGIDERIDLGDAAQRIGLEVVGEAEGSIEPNDEFGLVSDRTKDPMISTCLHAVCADVAAFNRLLAAWKGWQRTGQVPGNYQLRDLFAHLKDIRPWGPKDRLKAIDWREYFAERIDQVDHSIDIELWYRRTEDVRTRVQNEVAALLAQQGGRVLSSADIGHIGYHAMKCEVPTALLLQLAEGRFDDVKVVKSADVMFLRVGGQSAPTELVPVEPAMARPGGPGPGGQPALCLLDGVPVANHALLAGRVVVHDPDDLAASSAVGERKHGTAMASVAVWGDLSAATVRAASRPVLVRPVLVPSADTVGHFEELPANELAPDLMWRVFRELFESVGGSAAAGPEVVVVNLSIGDPTSPFDTILSAWARMLDWLSYHYGVLVVVSAGNHSHLRLSGLDSQSFTALAGPERRDALLQAIRDDWTGRRLLAPAEAINVLTVGAMHDDSSGVAPPGYLLDPADGAVSISPISALGGGYRRAIKPELAAPGGRATYRDGVPPGDSLTFNGASPIGPGIRVAAPSGNRETYKVGTSPAAALVSRRAARLSDLVDDLTRGRDLTRRQRAVAVKALVTHGTERIDELEATGFPTVLALGNGALRRDLSEGCATNEAVVLFVGSIGALQQQGLQLPLPDGLAVREVKRISATLAWLSPVNWRHRQYRRARLWFTKPHGDIPALDASVGVSSGHSQRGASTVQHLEWETHKSFAAGRGSTLDLSVSCFEQAGGLQGETIDYAAVVSLWVAPSIGVDVYTQVRDQLQIPVPVRPR